MLIADSDNAQATVPVDEIDSEQLQVILPGGLANVGDRYGRSFEQPLVATVAPSALPLATAGAVAAAAPAAAPKPVQQSVASAPAAAPATPAPPPMSVPMVLLAVPAVGVVAGVLLLRP
jgi:hypothetical protein